MPKLTKKLKQELNEFLAENLFCLKKRASLDLRKEDYPNYIEDYRIVLEWLSAEDDMHSVEVIKNEKGKSACRLTFYVDGYDYKLCREMFTAFLDEPFEARNIITGDTLGEAICLAAAWYFNEVKEKNESCSPLLSLN